MNLSIRSRATSLPGVITMKLSGIIFKNIVIFLALVGVLGVVMLGGCDQRQESSSPPPALEVAVVTVEPQKVSLTTKLPGRTAPFRIAEIRPQVSGLILKRLFKEGSDIKAGQVLYQIDPAFSQAALDNTKAALAKAEASLPAIRLRAARLQNLLAVGAVGKQEYDDAAAALKQAKAEVEYWKAQVTTARINLGYCRVTAPISGRIGRSNVTEGAIVTAYQPLALATIQQIDPIYVDVPQSTTELLRLKRRLSDGSLNQDGTSQNKVKLLLDDGAAYPWEGSLQFRDVTVDPTTGSVILRAVFANPQGVLLPGMFVQTLIKEGVNEQALLIPQQGVSRDFKGNPIALIVDAQGKVQQRMLALDRVIGDQWLVSSGLAPGDRVIVEGAQKVRPGAAVKAVPFKKQDGTKHAAPQNTARPTAESK